MTTKKHISSYNRLVIIGNGFDIAHGCKTSFKDFIYWYYEKILRKTIENQNFQDELINSKTNVLADLDTNKIKQLSPAENYSILNELTKKGEIEIIFLSTLLKNILNDFEGKKWVDIELIYYELLKKMHKSDDIAGINKLNKDLDFIKKELIIYLSSEVNNKIDIVNKQIIRQLHEPIQPSETKSAIQVKESIPDGICLLNFNYTDIANKYFSSIWIPEKFYIQIHGNLTGDNKANQEPIFGFGDELDPDYLLLERKNDNELLKHIKSFKYLQFNNYKTLLDFIENKPYQIYIYGHSCGLSDRTLLNTIFEHENCISIKPYYHESDNSDDYEEKSYAIARNFRSKEELRARVVNKKYCEPMVQPYKIKY